MPEICTLEHHKVSNYTQAVDAECTEVTGASNSRASALFKCVYTHTHTHTHNCTRNTTSYLFS